MTRVALVTGGTRGIGAAISTVLQQSGLRVAANYGGNHAAAHAFNERTGIPVFHWDVGSFEASSDGVRRVESELGPIDILVNNAGITRDGFFHKMSVEQWRSVMSTNLDALFNVTRPVVEGMRARNWGRIVVISSINGQKGQIGQVNYSASKAGDLGFVKALAQESASRGITVNAICPGYVATEMVQAVPPEVLNGKILPQIPVGRLGLPEEVGKAVAYLVSEDASFVTGSTLTINGGQFMAG